MMAGAAELTLLRLKNRSNSLDFINIIILFLLLSIAVSSFTKGMMSRMCPNLSLINIQ